MNSAFSEAPGDTKQSPVAPVDPLQDQIEMLERRFGLNHITATIAALSPILCACAGSRRIVNPVDLTPVPPSLALIIAGTIPNTSMAFNQMLSPVRNLMMRPVKPDRRENDRIRLRIAALHEQLIHQDQIIAYAKQPPIPGVDRLRGTAKEVEQQQQELEARRQAVVEEIEKLAFRLIPFFLVDDGPITGLLDPGALCLDGGVLHFARNEVELRRAPATVKHQFRHLLSRSWHGLPDAHVDARHTCPVVSSILATDTTGARALVTGGDMIRTGVYLVVESGGNSKIDLNANCQQTEAWEAGLSAMVESRVKGQIIDYHLAPDAIDFYNGQLNEILPCAKRWWPLLCLKLALLLHVASNRDELKIRVETMRLASTLAGEVCRGHDEFIQQATIPEKMPGLSVDWCVQTLRHRGPLRWRELLRASPSQRTEPLTAQLNAAMEAGLIKKNGEYYHAVN